MMTRFVLLAATCTGLVCAQENPLSTEIKARYTAIKNNLSKAADKMSEADYAFKPVDTIRTFGGLIGHVADSQLGACGRIKGEQKRGEASAKTAKTDLVAALKESFAYCDAAFDGLKDADLTAMTGTAPRLTSKSAAAWGLIVHTNEQYAYLPPHMPLTAVLPPSTNP